MAKMIPSNKIETKLDIFPWDIFKSDVMYFFIKNIKVFYWLSKLKFPGFMTKVNKNNENQTKSDILPWDIFKVDVIYFLSKNIKVFY